MNKWKNAGKTNRIKRKGISLLCAVSAFFALPVYGISWILFKTAVIRDNKSTFLQNKRVKALICKIDGAIKSIKNNQPNLNHEQYVRIADKGKQWFMGKYNERITVRSYDGVKLVAHYMPAEIASNKVIILMHGYRADGFVNFGGLVEFYHNRGYHLLIPYQRSHGESEGTYICYGVKERYDVKKWVQFITRRFDDNCTIFLSGTSMGASTVLMAAGVGLPPQVKGIIADCGFTSPWDIFSYVIKKDYHLPKIPFLYIADYICRLKAGFSFRECSTISCMKENRIPVLFIHGGKDKFVPIEMSYENYEACAAPKEILIIEEAAHGTCCLVESGAYKKTVMDFMEKWDGIYNGD